MPETASDDELDYHYNGDTGELFIHARGYATRHPAHDMLLTIEEFYAANQIEHSEYSELTDMVNRVCNNEDLFQDGQVFDGNYGRYYAFPEWVRNNTRTILVPNHLLERVESPRNVIDLCDDESTASSISIGTLDTWSIQDFADIECGETFNADVFIENINASLGAEFNIKE